MMTIALFFSSIDMTKSRHSFDFLPLSNKSPSDMIICESLLMSNPDSSSAFMSLSYSP